MVTPIYAWNQEGLPKNIYRHRTNWRGKLILQVGVATRLYSAMLEDWVDKYEWTWRDAETKDFLSGIIV